MLNHRIGAAERSHPAARCLMIGTKEKTHPSTNFAFVASSGDCINIGPASIQLGVHVGYLGWG